MTLKAQNCFLHKFHKQYNTTLLTFLFKLSNFNFGHSKRTQNSQQLYVTRETDQSSNNSCARHSRHIFNNFFFFKKVFSKHSFFLLAVVSKLLPPCIRQQKCVERSSSSTIVEEETSSIRQNWQSRDKTTGPRKRKRPSPDV